MLLPWNEDKLMSTRGMENDQNDNYKEEDNDSEAEEYCDCCFCFSGCMNCLDLSWRDFL